MKLYMVMTAHGPAHSYQGPVALYTTPNRARAANKTAFARASYEARLLEIDTDDLKEAT